MRKFPMKSKEQSDKRELSPYVGAKVLEALRLGLTPSEVARKMDVTRDFALQILDANRDDIANYNELMKKEMVYVLRKVAMDCALSICPADLAKAPLQAKVMSSAIATDKAQILTNDITEKIEFMSDTELENMIIKTNKEVYKLKYGRAKVGEDFKYDTTSEA